MRLFPAFLSVEMQCLFLAVGTEFVNIIGIVFVFLREKKSDVFCVHYALFGQKSIKCIYDGEVMLVSLPTCLISECT